MLFFMLAAFLPLVLACDVFLLGTATVDTSLYVQILLRSLLILSHRYIIFTVFSLVNDFIPIIDIVFEKLFYKRCGFRKINVLYYHCCK